MEGSPKVLRRLGNDWVALLISLFLAFSVWFVHGMSLKYMVPMKFNVTIVTDLDGYAGESVNDDVLVIRSTGTGFSIVGLRRSANVARSIKLNVPGEKLHRIAEEGDLFEVYTRDLTEELYQVLGSSVTINSFDTEKLQFRLTPRIHKKVPLVLNSDIDCKSQYMVASNIVLKPDSVAVYGDVSILEGITYAETEKVSFYNAAAPLDGNVRIKPLRGAEMSASTVEYHIDVVRYVELTAEVSFTPIGVPAGVNMVMIPASGTVRYRVPYALAGSVDTQPVFGVYYSDFIASRSGVVVPKLYSAPSSMISYELEPASVECVVIEL